MACIELSIEQQGELLEMITQSVVAAVGDKQRAVEVFVESIEFKGLQGWLAAIVFNGIVNDLKPWHSGYNIEFASAFTTKHREHE
jgi:phenylpyruvate tautomerase PptA (4-oxalocrotonate tautomerase family)